MHLTIWIYCRANTGQQATSELPPPKKEDAYHNYKLRIWLQALKISHKVKGVMMEWSHQQLFDPLNCLWSPAPGRSGLGVGDGHR